MSDTDIDEITEKLLSLNLPSTDSSSNTEDFINNINSLFAGTATTETATSTINPNNLNLNLNSSNANMAQFKPEYLNCVPQFDGNANDLNRYLAVCQSIVDTFFIANQPNNFQNIYLLNSIIGKLTGNAKLILGTQNVTTWDQLKQTLNRHFADQRDEACLNRDLVMLRQTSEQPSQFYDRVMHILNLLCSYVDNHEVDQNAKNLKRNLYNDLALKTFLSGLREPLGTTIRCMRPKDLPEALQFVTQEYNTQYFQNMSKNQQKQPPQQQFKANTQQKYNKFNTFNANTPNNAFAQQRFPSQPVHVRPDYNKIQQRFPTNAQVFKNKNQTNVFKPGQNKNFTRPTPMSTTTRQTNFATNPQQPSGNNYFQVTQPRNFVSEELYHTNTANLNELAENNQETYYESEFDPQQGYDYSDNYNLDSNNDLQTAEIVEYDTAGTSEESNFQMVNSTDLIP